MDSSHFTGSLQYFPTTRRKNSHGSSLLMGEDREFGFSDHSYFEKRQLFLRSYQFQRKKCVRKRMGFWLVGLKRLIWVKLTLIRRFKRLVWRRLGIGHGRKKFYRLRNSPYIGDWTMYFQVFRL
ncbi:hypothetical protein AMTRI_Chr03g143420 [Amborella trichopoda]